MHICSKQSFYLEQTAPSLLFLQVGAYLYNLHFSTFTDLSDIFEHIYSLPQGDSVEGKSDDVPFVLQGIDAMDFDHLFPVRA